MKIGNVITKPLKAKNSNPDMPQMKYPKPKILLLDLPETATDLVDAGFNVSTGTLGRPYKVTRESGYQALLGQAQVPNHTEQEIVVIDLSFGKLADRPVGEKHRPNGELDLWGKCDHGFLDPRVRTSNQLKQPFDRIFSNGGAFIVFADAKTGIHVQTARINRHNSLYDDNDFQHDVWDILSELSDMSVESDHGTEMRIVTSQSPLVRLLEQHLEGAKFTCTLKGGYHRYEPWEPLVLNKYGGVVGVARFQSGKGSIIVLPQIADKTGFISKLFTNVLPELAPHLFPHIERGVWTHHPEYELSKVIELKSEQEDIARRAKEEIELLENELEKERETQGWIHNLLTGTDDELVAAVVRALSELGFSGVVDVDEERDKEGKSRREDLQITDQSPTLVIDIKGIGGYPSDDDALQADKHATIRMREEKRTDINGLSIINHQRHLPPLERENAMPFRQELIDVAEERSLGLMTAWELYRFVRNLRKLGWKGEAVKPVFYNKGRIEVIPLHYQFIGIVAKAWTNKFGVVVQKGELRIGERIAIEFPIEFEEIKVDSIRVNDQNVEVASVGDPAGLLWPTDGPKLREGMRVFRIVAT